MEKELNEKEFLKKTENEIKNYEILKSIFDKIYESDSKLFEKRNEVLDQIENFDEQDNGPLKNIYNNFSKEMRDLENIRNTQIKAIKEKIIPAIAYNNYNTKEYKKRIGKYKDTKKDIEKKEYEMSKARASGNDNKAEEIDDNLKQSKREIIEKGQDLEKDFVQFEIDRIMNNKYIFLHFIHSEMAYHAKSLEKLTGLFKLIKDENPLLGMKNFIQSHNYQSVDPTDYGYDEREEIKKSKMKSKNQSKVSSSVKPSLKISGLGKSTKGMLKKSAKDDFEEIQNSYEEDE